MACEGTSAGPRQLFRCAHSSCQPEGQKYQVSDTSNGFPQLASQESYDLVQNTCMPCWPLCKCGNIYTAQSMYDVACLDCGVEVLVPYCMRHVRPPTSGFKLRAVPHLTLWVLNPAEAADTQELQAVANTGFLLQFWYVIVLTLLVGGGGLHCPAAQG
eukprot:2400382-Amphidinium_carterae.1